MTSFIEALSIENSYTENGCLANSTSLNACLDYFYIAGNRNSNIEPFKKAFSANPDLALKILFWSRDCRGGAGNRQNFIAVIKYLQESKPEVFSKIFKHIPEYGYWKDLFNLTPSKELVEFIGDELENASSHSLCAKYCPRKGIWAGLLRRYLNMSPKEFRKFIVNKTQVVEQLMCSNNWSEINYETVPSVANLRYSNSFRRHDSYRYDNYLKEVLAGKSQIHSAQLFPYQLFQKSYQSNFAPSPEIEALWNNLPNYMQNNKERVIPVCDVSGSMYGTPLDVSVSLGCYISERNIGPFKNAFITFSEDPSLEVLPEGSSIVNKFKSIKRSSWGMNTNIQKVFELILNRAVRFNLSSEDIPTMILIISDMQFDMCSVRGSSSTALDMIRYSYQDAGYNVPKILFWNVRGDAGSIPAIYSDFNVGLVSGFSPSILESVLSGEPFTPIDIMLRTVTSERYSRIHL